ncbi:hypothetical protein IFT84_07985 [Rhizobium sp. CFBP 8762]|uniref:hypothetical protein n=1 Tax=Rhizobium sp. CFBP 8762 TaxID=2775279 RepID=UPI00177BE62C|nr:hypothetical protein [Rhizobium sp. CFBP 8762]MBD8554468.1 hypothetical protein [Rhizobium sp. CFBP 8762]
MEIVARLAKPVIMGLIMYFSVLKIGGTPVQAGMLALIPLLLGWINILTSLAYTVTAATLIAAVVLSFVPPEGKTQLVAVVNEIVNNGRSAVRMDAPTPTTPQNPAVQPAPAPVAP